MISSRADRRTRERCTHRATADQKPAVQEMVVVTRRKTESPFIKGECVERSAL
jgi:hypothetical protein